VTAVLLGVALTAGGCGSSAQSSSRPKSSSVATTAASSSRTSSASGLNANELASLPSVREAARAGRLPSPVAGTVDRSFLGAVFDDAQRLWADEFAAAGKRYSPAKLVIFSANVESACGVHENGGPFYCPGDHGIYLDVRWFAALARLHGVGDFAQAYIVGHEFGHHVQRLLGVDVGALGQRNVTRKNALSVAGELQADCLAGVWAHSVYTQAGLSDSDIDDMLNKANVIGDDFAARSAGRPVDTGLFTHGSSAQRQHWLQVGFRSGDPNACDTFSGLSLRP
jgi:predicted metalloprotease